MSRSPRPGGRERAVLWLVVAAYAIVLAVAHAQAQRQGWVLMGDDAIVVLRSGDLFSSHTPLVGMPSSFGGWADGAADPFHPGATTLWVMGLGTAAFGTAEATVLAVTWAISVASLLVIVAVARRVSGDRLAVASVGALLALQLSTSWPIWSPLTPAVAAQPMLALTFATWGIACGRHELWPWWLGLGAFVTHADLSYATSVLPLLVLVVATTSRRVWHAHRAGEPWPLSRSTIAASAAVLVVTWAGPVAEALGNTGGNLLELYRASRVDLPTEGLAAVPEALGGLLAPDAAGALAPVVVGVAWLVVASLATVGLARPRPGRRFLAVTAGLAAGGAIVGQAMVPVAARGSGLLDYPLEPAAAFFGFAAVVLAVDGARTLTRAWSSPRLRVPAAAVAVPIAVAVVALATRPALDDGRYLEVESPGVASLGAQLDEALPDGRYLWLPMGGPDAVAFTHALNLRLLDLGIEPRVEPPLGRYYGDGRVFTGDEAGVLYLTSGPAIAPTDEAELVARWQSEADDDPALEALRHALADEIRAGPIAFTSSSNPFTTGTIAVGSGGGPGAGLVDGVDAFAVGAELEEDPDRVRALSDHAVVSLAQQRAIEWPERPDFSQDLFELRAASALNVWLAPLEG